MVPSLTGVAVNVTFVPVQIVVAVAAMLTDGTTDALTVTVNEQFKVGDPVNTYCTFVTPALNVWPLAVPLPLPVVAPVSV